MVRAFLLLGSNEGNRHDYLEKVRFQIVSQVGKILAESSIYESAAWGNTGQPAFLNQIIKVETNLSPHELLKTVLHIETTLGRIRTEKWASRTLDIDILFYGDEIIETPELTIPHPAIASRRFTLVPLAELAPDYVHSVLKKSGAQLLAECTDKLEVRKWERKENIES